MAFHAALANYSFPSVALLQSLMNRRSKQLICWQNGTQLLVWREKGKLNGRSRSKDHFDAGDWE